MTDQIKTQVKKGVAHLTLNRPTALNALNEEMLTEIAARLESWRSDPAVEVVLIDGEGEPGLCAGGDVRAVRQAIVDGRPQDARRYFRVEYAVDAMIAEYPKPVVVLMDGVTMGGGIGIGVHASHRVVTQRSVLAMPEARIGFTPDVGSTLVLGRAPGRWGEYLAISGATMTGADAIAAGFADAFVPSESLGAFTAALLAGADADAAVAAMARPAPPSELAAKGARIDECYAAPTATEIVERLRTAGRAGDEAATAEADEIERLSPTSVVVALEAVRRGRAEAGLTAGPGVVEPPGLAGVAGPPGVARHPGWAQALHRALAREYAVACWFVDTQHDFVEGVRAQLVDKDRDPKWQPATLAEMGAEVVARAFGYTPAEPDIHP